MKTQIEQNAWDAQNMGVVCGHCCRHCAYSRGMYRPECNQVYGKFPDTCRKEHADGDATCQQQRGESEVLR